MTWVWFAHVEHDEPIVDALLEVATTDRRGEKAGRLVFWPNELATRPAPDALRVDARVMPVEGSNDATWVSLCRFAGGSLPFDDAAVSAVLREKLAKPWTTFCSTLLVDWSRIAGAFTTARDEHSVVTDPFARLFPRRVFRIEAGALGTNPAPTGPGITRYGSGNPWPWDRYAGQVS